MKSKRLLLGIALLLTAGGIWLTRSGWLGPADENTSVDAATANSDVEQIEGGNPASRPDVEPERGHALLPPDQTRRFRDFTPEQRVEFARRGHGPGG
jgi:hypothetical protein